MELEIYQPPIVCYLHHAYPLTAVMSHKDFDSWFFSNYIQLEYRLGDDSLNFFTYVICGNSIFIPLIDYKVLDLEFISKINTSIIDFIKSSIEIGYYVTTYLDEFFIPEREAYKKIHFRHEIMIYGFDSDKKILKVIGYNNEKTYATSSVSFSEFEDAYLNSIDKKNDLILLKAKDNSSYQPSYEFDIENVKNLLYDYLYSKNSSARLRSIGNPTNNFVYGVSVYNQLIKYYLSIIEDDKKVCDIRHLHLLYEHKKTMVSRIKYLIAENYINSENNFISIFSELQNDALNRRNNLIKYNIAKNKTLINVTIDCLEKMRDKEKKAVEDLLEAISTTQLR
jgi:hypothetical protein